VSGPVSKLDPSDPEVRERLASIAEDLRAVEQASRACGDFDWADLHRENLEAIHRDPCGPAHLMAVQRITRECVSDPLSASWRVGL
jgi:hypothetical protein